MKHRQEILPHFRQLVCVRWDVFTTRWEQANTDSTIFDVYL